LSGERRGQRGSFYGDKPSKAYEARRRGREGEYGGRGERSAGDKPVELGKEYRVRITDMSGRGEGVAKVEGFIVFVRGAKPSEEVTVKITRLGARAATGEIVPEQKQTLGQTSSSQNISAEISPAEAVKSS
jgi:predicted RNA-binding protein with TRAM domain